MERVERESFRLDCLGFASGFERCEALEGLQSSVEVVGFDEVAKMAAELVVHFIVEALDSRFLERPVYAFKLAVGPRVPRLGEPVVYVVLGTGVFEGMRAEQLPAVHGASDF